MKYKEVVMDLIQFLNDTIEDPFLKLRGRFRLCTTRRSTVTSDNTAETLLIELYYNEVSELPIIKKEYTLSTMRRGLMTHEEMAYKEFYHELLRYILFARDNTEDDGLRDNYMNGIIVIPIDKLMRRGFNERR